MAAIYPTSYQLPEAKVLQNSDLEWMIQTGRVESLSAQKILIQEGVPCDVLYFVLEGTLRISTSQGAADIEIAQLSAGELVDEMSFIGDRAPSVTVESMMPCQVIAVPKRKLRIKLEQDLDFAVRFYHEATISLSGRLRGLSSLLAQSKVLPGQSLRKVLYLFSVLNDNDIDWLTTYGRQEQSTTGTVLIQQGEPVEAIYFLLQGTLSVVITIPVDGIATEREIAQRSSGEMVGEMSFVEIGNASATIRCAENSRILAIPQALLREKLQKDRGFASRLYHALAIILVDRLWDDLLRRGFSARAYAQDQPVDDQYEEDEIPLDVLETTLLAGTRFKWMMNRLNGSV
jgi:CRP-like cAMP-binding protein